MPRTISRSVRYSFVALTGALLLLAGVQSFGRTPRMGLSTCGTDDNPCVLEALVVKAAPAARAEPEMTPTAVEVAHPVQALHAPKPSRADAQS